MKKLTTLAFIFYCFSSNAQNFISDTIATVDISTSDSFIIQKFQSMNANWDSASDLRNSYGERMTRELVFDEVKHSEDSSFKIFRFKWEEQGIYSYEVDELVIGVNDTMSGKLQLIMMPEVLKGEIDSIKNMGEGKYLLLGSYWSRAQGGGSNTHNTAYLISINDKIEALWSFDIYTSDQDEDGFVNCTFNLDLKTISYKYKFYDDGDYKTNFIKEGIWKFENGIFVHTMEKTTYLR